MSLESRLMQKSPIGSFFVGLYAWISAVWFGVILMDSVYGLIFSPDVRTDQILAAFHTVSDLLFFLVGPLFLAGLTAIVFSLGAASARTPIALSFLLLLMEMGFPMLVSMFPQLAPALEGPGFAIRIGGGALVTLLAFWGLNSYLWSDQ